MGIGKLCSLSLFIFLGGETWGIEGCEEKKSQSKQICLCRLLSCGEVGDEGRCYVGVVGAYTSYIV